MKIIAVIPARYESSRFPGKLLKEIDGESIIYIVYKKVVSSELFDDVIVATDHEKIFSYLSQKKVNVKMTSVQHKSGTDRIAEVVENMKADIVVNIQGDEPFITKKVLKDILIPFADKQVRVASLMHKMKEKEIINPNFVKVITDNNNDSIYFSRAPIPFNRDQKKVNYFRHIGVYAFRKETLLGFIDLPEGQLEAIEKLEQLRLLENGVKIRMVETEYDGFGIDVEADLILARKKWKQETIG